LKTLAIWGTSCLLLIACASQALSQIDEVRLGRLPIPADTLEQIQLLPTLEERVAYYNEAMGYPDAAANCADGSIDFWRLRRLCTDRAGYAWAETVRVEVRDRITNWNTFPWTFEGTSGVLVSAADTIPHTVNLRVRNQQGQTVLNWEATVIVIPHNWSFRLGFLGWAETIRELALVNFAPGEYTIVAELRATGYQNVTLTVRFLIDRPVNVTESGVGATYFQLWQNYPNPFNGTTQITFFVPQPVRAVLTVYNLLGQPVATLYNGPAQPGVCHTVSYQTDNLPSGVYVYRLNAGDFSQTKKMTVIR